MARTKQYPISIVVSDPKWGTVVWVLSPREQKQFREIPEEDLPGTVEELRAMIAARLEGANRDICDVTRRASKRHANALVELESGEQLATGGASDTDDPRRPFVHGANV